MQPSQAAPKRISRLVLVGFMGAGKSTVGPLLAARLGWEFVDADHFLQGQTGTSIADIFSRSGETHFREIEAAAIAEVHHRQQLVLALGGGAIETQSTRNLLEMSVDTWVVFLKAPLGVLIERCEQQSGATLRPLLQQKETLADRLNSRLQHYERAHITVETMGLSPHQVAEEIAARLQDYELSVQWTQKAETLE